MAGHSKWANIQHRKGAQDAKRGKLFSRLIREVSISARLGGGSPDGNSRLRQAIDKALAGNVPKDTIDRAIRRASGDAALGNLEEVRYEGFGPGGAAVVADCVTDNRNRTVAEVRHAFTKCGGNLGSDGSVGYLFNRVGQLSYPAGVDEDALMEAAIEAGAEDVVTNDDGSFEVVASPEEYEAVRDALRAAGLEPEEAGGDAAGGLQRLARSRRIDPLGAAHRGPRGPGRRSAGLFECRHFARHACPHRSGPGLSRVRRRPGG